MLSEKVEDVVLGLMQGVGLNLVLGAGANDLVLCRVQGWEKLYFAGCKGEGCCVVLCAGAKG